VLIDFYLTGFVSPVRSKSGFLTESDSESVPASVWTSNGFRSKTLDGSFPPMAVASNGAGQ
jgi:hypothetical protein